MIHINARFEEECDHDTVKNQGSGLVERVREGYLYGNSLNLTSRPAKSGSVDHEVSQSHGNGCTAIGAVTNHQIASVCIDNFLAN